MSARTVACWRTSWPHPTLLPAGARRHSDWPNAPLNPFLGLYAAITRSTSDGAFPAGWHPEQKLTTKEAIEAYTLKSAYAEFAENDKGSITVGKLADFVVLSNDLLTADPAQIPSLTVEMTVVGGKIVYTSSAGNGH